MENENFYLKMDSYCAISPALKAYLSIALVKRIIPAHHQIEERDYSQTPILFIEQGTCKTKLQSKKEPDESILILHLEHTFLTESEERNPDDFAIQTVAIAPSILVGIPEKHIYNLYRLFPEFHVFINALHREQLSKLFHLAFSIRHLSADERFEQIISRHPDIFQIASSIDIASSLGIHSHTLSTLKKKYLSGKRRKT